MSVQGNAKRIADVLMKIVPKGQMTVTQGIVSNVDGGGKILASVNGSPQQVTPVTDDAFKPGEMAWMLKTKDMGYVVLGPVR